MSDEVNHQPKVGVLVRYLSQGTAYPSQTIEVSAMRKQNLLFASDHINNVYMVRLRSRLVMELYFGYFDVVAVTTELEGFLRGKFMAYSSINRGHYFR